MGIKVHIGVYFAYGPCILYISELQFTLRCEKSSILLDFILKGTELFFEQSVPLNYSI